MSVAFVRLLSSCALVCGRVKLCDCVFMIIVFSLPSIFPREYFEVASSHEWVGDRGKGGEARDRDRVECGRA